MPWCPKCGLEYIERVKVCPDCELPLRDSPVLEDAKPYLDEEGWVAVVELNDVHEAEIVVGLLESKGINAMARDHLGALRNLYGGFSFFGEKIAVYVPKEDAEWAASIIRDRSD